MVCVMLLKILISRSSLGPDRKIDTLSPLSYSPKSLWHEPRPKHSRTVRGFNWGKIMIFRSMLIWYSYSYYMFTFLPALCCSETLPSVRQEISRRSSTTLATFMVWGGLGPVVLPQKVSFFSFFSIKVTRPSFFDGVPSYFEALWYPHLYFYR